MGARYGGDFSRYKESHMNDLANKLISKEKTMDDLTKDMKYYDYYLEAYSAVLGGMVGEYKIEVADESAEGAKHWEEKYGLKAFLPLAKTIHIVILTILVCLEAMVLKESTWDTI